MNRKTTQIVKLMRNTKLQAQEKTLVKSNILKFIRENPSPALHNHPGFFKNFFGTSKKYVLASITVVAMLVGGTAYAAEFAVPGEVLYPIKIKINENIRGAFYTDPESKINFEIELAERRLLETEQLVLSKTLTNETAEALETHFSQHLENSYERIEKLINKGDMQNAIAACSRLEATLKVHAKIIAELANYDSSDQLQEYIDFLEQTVNQVHTVANKRAKHEAEFTESSEVEETVEKQINALENKISEAEKYLNQWKASISAESYTEAQAELQAAAEDKQKALLEMEAENNAEAFIAFQEGMRHAISAKKIVQAHRVLNLNPQAEESKEKNSENKNDNFDTEQKNNSTGNSEGNNDTSATDIRGNSQQALERVRQNLQDAAQIKTKIETMVTENQIKEKPKVDVEVEDELYDGFIELPDL